MKMAAQVFKKQSRALFEASQNNTKLLADAVSALFKSGKVLSKVDGQRGQAADLLLETAIEALQLPEWQELEKDVVINDEVGITTDFGSLGIKRKLVKLKIKLGATQRGTIPESLTLAEKIFKDIGEFSKADHCHYMLSRYRRTKYTADKLKRLNPFYLFSLFLDMIWGYGTRPFRLFPFGFAATLAFAVFYFLIGDVNWETGPVTIGNRMIACVTLSVFSFCPAKIIESISQLKLLPAMNIGSVSLVGVWVENLLGLAFWSMVGFSIIRWFKRQFIPKS